MPVLQWLTRDKDLRAAGRAPYRLLEEAGRHGDGCARNMLIQGDNLHALKALLPYYAGKVKCIYIDRRTIPEAPLSTMTTIWSIRGGCP